jgi:hypothetical protein
MFIIDPTYRIFNTADAAQKIADANNEDADGWEYKVIVDPQGSGRAVIKIYDEDGEFLGNL